MRRNRSSALVFGLSLLAMSAGCTPEPSPTPTLPVVRSTPPAPGPTEEPYVPVATENALIRPVWVHLFDDVLKTRAGIRQVVAELVSAEATAVVVEVVRRQDAYYDSEVLARTADPALEPGLDVLGAMIEEAHAAGLEVHAWIPVAPTWHDSYAGLVEPPGWLTAEHGVGAPEVDRWVTRTFDGAWDTSLDFGLPEVREHLAAVVGEIAAGYDVDGIHLDYIRYSSNRHGYHPRALAAFQAETGSVGVPEPTDPAWSDWRRQQVTAAVQAARDAIGAVGSRAVLSAAVISWGDGPGGSLTRFSQTQAYANVLQDWAGWAASGVVDVLMPMNYFREYDADQARWLRTWFGYQQQLAAATGTRVVPAVACYLNSSADAVTQVGLAMSTFGAAGVFSYQQSTSEVGAALWSDLAATDWGTANG